MDATEDDLMPDSVTSVAQYQEVHQFLTQKMGDAEYWKKTPYYSVCFCDERKVFSLLITSQRITLQNFS
jgi:hypothetical protein